MMRSTLSCILLIAALVCQSFAFERTGSTISPFDTPYTQWAGIANLSAQQVLPVGDVGINSFGTAYWIVDLETQQSWFFSSCVIGYTGPTGETQQTFFMTQLNLNDSSFQSTANNAPAEISSTRFDWKFSNIRSYSPAADGVSQITYLSTIPGLEVNLTSTAAGPNFYHAGSGIFFWGTDLTHEWSEPQSKLEGTFHFKGKNYTVDPRKSVAWFDRQYGPGFPAAGHHYFAGSLSNGLLIAAWRVLAVGENPGQALITVMNVDGSLEVHPFDPDIHASGNFTAPISGNTYQSNYVIDITGIGFLKITIPVPYGEAVNATAPDKSSIFFETYTTFKGVWRGQPVTGFGSVEIHGSGGL